MSGIVFTQPQPAHPAMAYNATLGTLTPVGGIGPFAWTVVDRLADRYTVEAVTGRVYGYYNPLTASNDTVQFSCTDGRGTTVTRAFPVRKMADTGAGVIFFNSPPGHTATNNIGVSPRWALEAWGGGHGLNDKPVITNLDGSPTTEFQISYDNTIVCKGALAAPGAYPLKATLTSPGGQAITATVTPVIVPYTPIAYIEFIPGTISTSMTTGAVLGRALATTPSNRPTWSLTDPSGTLAIDGTGVVTIRKQPPQGTLAFSIGVTDQVASYTQPFTIAVPAGTILPPRNMTLRINPNLRNVGRGQPVGTASVKGITGTKRWSMVQDNYNLLAVKNGTLGYRYAVDPATGVVTAPGLLSAQTDRIVLTCTDGLNTCSQTFEIPVAGAPVGTTYHVGRGMAALHGANGFEHIADVRARCMGERTDTCHILLYADRDPNYYADDTGVLLRDGYPLRFAWHGPIVIEGVAANGVAQPRTGGNTAKWSNTGNDMRGKGFWVFGDGDATLINVEVSHCFGGDQTHGVEAIRKDGETYGNLTLRKCRIANADNGIETGFGGSDILVEDCEIAQCGTSHVSGGACHNFYIGQQWRVTVRRCLSVMTMTGHEFKSRAVHGLIEDSRFFDLERGSASCQIDLPSGGDYVVQNNVFHKGPMGQNPFSLQFGAEIDPADPTSALYRRSNLLAQNNVFRFDLLPGAVSSGAGAPAAIALFNLTDFNGNPITAEANTNSFWLSPTTTTIKNLQGHAGLAGNGRNNLVETGSTLLPTPPALDLTRPWLKGALPLSGPWRAVTEWTNHDFQNFGTAGHYIGSDMLYSADEIRVPVTAAPGTVVIRLTASVPRDDNDGAPRPNPFVAGTSWSLIRDPLSYPYVLPGSVAPWAPDGRYAITSNPDGTAALTVTGALAPGMDWVHVRAASPSSPPMLADRRISIAVAAS
ncbi:MAG: hypothetical protein NVSMB18_14980 [Acetobacteraceae bacterium]